MIAKISLILYIQLLFFINTIFTKLYFLVFWCMKAGKDTNTEQYIFYFKYIFNIYD
jgi:hypothetical protein